MNLRPFPHLDELARLHGLQSSYRDVEGKSQPASPEVLVAVLDALGIPAHTSHEVRDRLRETRLRPYQQRVEPVAVAWEKRAAKVRIHLPRRVADKPLRLRLRSAGGRVQEFTPRLRTLGAVEVEGQRFTTKEFALPTLPFGYHQLEIAAWDIARHALVLSAPLRSYAAARTPKGWGAFLPLYAAHSAQSWGAGNFSDWQRLSRWIGSLGGTVAATLPVLAAFLDAPRCEPSPYSPASRLFWNEFYLDLTRVPEFARCASAQKAAASAGFQKQLRAFRSRGDIDYAAQWAARRRVLKTLAEFFFSESSPRRTRFDRYVRERPEAEDYAAFRAACDRLKTAWHHWPQRLRDGGLRPGDYAEATKRFHLYTQWLAREQMDELAAGGKRDGVKLYLDLPLGVNPDGYDVWRERDSFALGANAGAPPDLFFTKGQDWGFAPLHPRHIRESGYRHVLDYLRFQMRHAGMLRIDHVMGLHRLYWIPRGFPASQGVYVGYPAAELHAIFNLESHRHRTLLVGENLGTVPPEVNESLKRHRLREMFVGQYELRPRPQAAFRKAPALSVASVNTHDMPPFAAFWNGDDLADRHQLGLIPNSELRAERQNRERLKQALMKFLSAHGFLNEKKPGARNVLHAFLAWLGAGASKMVLVNLEDLWLETRPQNVPGTSTERPNWRHKAKLSLEQLQQDPDVRDLLRQLKELRGC